MPEEPSERVIVAHLLERAGLTVDETELDDLVEIYRYNRDTSALLFSEHARELLR